MGSPEPRLKPIREEDSDGVDADADIEEALRDPRELLLGMQWRATRRYEIFRELFLLRVLRCTDEEEETQAGSSTLFDEDESTPDEEPPDGFWSPWAHDYHYHGLIRCEG